jgi:hypothetical protein
MALRKPHNFKWLNRDTKLWGVQQLQSGRRYWCSDCGKETFGWYADPMRMHRSDCPRLRVPRSPKSGG